MTTATGYATRTRSLIMKFPGGIRLPPQDHRRCGNCRWYVGGLPQRPSALSGPLVGSVAVRSGGAALLGRPRHPSLKRLEMACSTPPGSPEEEDLPSAVDARTRCASLCPLFRQVPMVEPGRSQSRVALMPSERTRAQPALFTAALRGERMPGTRTDQAQICARAIGAAGPNASRPETSFGCRVIRTARASRSISHRRSAAGSPRRRLPNPGPAAHSQAFGG
jgi:hypothetical protein